MKFLVLGSAGLIGTALTTLLTNKGHDVVGLDIENSPDQDLRIQDNPVLHKAVQDCDYVFFLAFNIGGSKFLAEYQKTFEFLDNNMHIMMNVFKALKTYNKPFLFATTFMSQVTRSSYGALKLVGEHATNTLDGRNVCFWNPYGYQEPGKKSHVITDFIHQAATTGMINMLSEGLEQRQFLHADEAASALYSLSQHHDQIDKSEKLHVTSFSWSSIVDVANKVASNFNDCQVNPGNQPDRVQQGVRVEPDKHILKYWKPTASLDDGIKRTIARYLEIKQ
jgi:nucleoside-diphosphate-sugar epimerase